MSETKCVEVALASRRFTGLQTTDFTYQIWKTILSIHKYAYLLVLVSMVISDCMLFIYHLRLSYVPRHPINWSHPCAMEMNWVSSLEWKNLHAFFNPSALIV